MNAISLGTKQKEAKQSKAREAFDRLSGALTSGPGLLVLYASDGGVAEKLAKKAERKKTEEMERRAAQEAASRSVPKANPFSVSIYWHIRVQMPT